MSQDRCTGKGFKPDRSNQKLEKSLGWAHSPEMTLWTQVTWLPTFVLLFCHLGKFPLCSESQYSWL